ncbi:VRR-NUC domain-containing protein [Liberibacter phage FP2]|uniref:VRR-NUC domain-containing protein n=2 Tax=Liberibacter asiaticus TaxID=34021 RepID=C6XH56_LIBAP|nr:VRR-NUC domain-containing protein [Candidatus Liberibacter asiaticus]YP_007011091.1 endonuclease [Liberibacter phage SC1]AEL31387.1 VRR-NUC domain-containing protein [Liberibacter phage FP2]ACT56601.1 VRR-NUC domain-containing protein [Candidatus Liberibacter asiaticus str. psy62]ADV02522.1 endonuclease [Liberibacter phage SC1]ADV02664.1 endonuclease [Liberibacter phage SC1] [Candidatus Liberibacter asiaticus]
MSFYSFHYQTEKDVEKRLVTGAKKLDCWVRKASFVGRRGCPDRLIITPNGGLWWIEVKKPTGRLSHQQMSEIEELRRRGQRVKVLVSMEEVDNFLEELACTLY